MNPNQTELSPDIASSTDDYSKRFSGQIGEWFLHIQSQGTSCSLLGIEQKNIVDVGGGHAQNISTLLESEHALTVTGSDESCSSRLSGYLKEGRIDFIVSPLTDLPFKDREFSAAVSYRMMSHLDNWKAFVAELCRVSDERVVVDYPTVRSINILNTVLFSLKKGVEKNTREFLIFREKEIIAEFKAQGFQLKSRFGQFVCPMAFHRMHRSVKLGQLLEGFFRVVGFSYLFGSPVIACFERIKNDGDS